MTAPLSIIIPTLNAAQQVTALMQDLMAGVSEGLIAEVIIADGGSTDAIQAIAQDTGAVFINSPKGRGSQLRHGITKARADWLLVLHADTQLPPNWPLLVLDHIRTRPEYAAYFGLRFSSHHPMALVTATWANLRSRVFGLPYGDQGLLVSRDLYDICGGYLEIPLMEDVEIARKLRGRLRALPDHITTSADRYQTRGWLRQGSRNIFALMRYLMGASPEALAKRYNARFSSNCK